VVDDHAVARLEAFAAGADGSDLAAGLVPGDGAGKIPLGPLAEMGAIDGANVGAADARGLGF
jgi:hypothetical protein